MSKRLTEAEYEATIARRFVGLAAARRDELAANPTRDVAALAGRMEAMGKHLAGLPASREFDLRAMDDLARLYDQCARLRDAIDATLRPIRGW